MKVPGYSIDVPSIIPNSKYDAKPIVSKFNKSLEQKVNEFCFENSVKLVSYQEVVIQYLDMVKAILDIQERLTFGYSAENEIAIEYIVSENDQRAIMIGQEDNDTFFIRFFGKPVAYELLHIEDENININDLVTAFTTTSSINAR